MTYIRFVVLFIPMPFLFHFIETSFANGFAFAVMGTFLYIVLAGLLSTRSKFSIVFLIHILTIILSVLLGKRFIIPPNPSWFNPFGVEFAIVFTGVVIFIAVIIARFVLLEFRK